MDGERKRYSLRKNAKKRKRFYDEIFENPYVRQEKTETSTLTKDSYSQSTKPKKKNRKTLKPMKSLTKAEIDAPSNCDNLSPTALIKQTPPKSETFISTPEKADNVEAALPSAPVKPMSPTENEKKSKVKSSLKSADVNFKNDESIHRVLLHAIDCKKASCNTKKCKIAKQFVFHAEGCTKERQDCTICRAMDVVVERHAQNCTVALEGHCRVPKCDQFRLSVYGEYTIIKKKLDDTMSRVFDVLTHSRNCNLQPCFFSICEVIKTLLKHVQLCEDKDTCASWKFIVRLCEHHQNICENIECDFDFCRDKHGKSHKAKPKNKSMSNVNETLPLPNLRHPHVSFMNWQPLQQQLNFTLNQNLAASWCNPYLINPFVNDVQYSVPQKYSEASFDGAALNEMVPVAGSNIFDQAIYSTLPNQCATPLLQDHQAYAYPGFTSCIPNAADPTFPFFQQQDFANDWFSKQPSSPIPEESTYWNSNNLASQSVDKETETADEFESDVSLESACSDDIAYAIANESGDSFSEKSSSNGSLSYTPLEKNFAALMAGKGLPFQKFGVERS